MKSSIKKLDSSEVEIDGELSAEEFETEREAVLAFFAQKTSIPGFRPGHVPEPVLVEKIGESAILEEMAERAIARRYPELLREHNIHAIGRPQVTVTKLARGNPFTFRIVQAVLPEVTLPDYKKIAREINATPLPEVSVTDKEVEDVLEEIRRMRASDKEKKELPELSDAFAQSLGDFKTIDDLKTKIRENEKMNKEGKERDKRRLTIVDNIISALNINLPVVLVDRELDNLMERMKADIAGMGIKFEDYLTHIKKTEEEVKTESRSAAEKRAKFGLVMDAIAEAEKIVVPPDDIETEAIKVMEQYKDADKDAVRHYVEGVQKNQAVFKLLEESK